MRCSLLGSFWAQRGPVLFLAVFARWRGPGALFFFLPLAASLSYSNRPGLSMVPPDTSAFLSSRILVWCPSICICHGVFRPLSSALSRFCSSLLAILAALRIKLLWWRQSFALLWWCCRCVAWWETVVLAGHSGGAGLQLSLNGVACFLVWALFVGGCNLGPFRVPVLL